MFFLLSFRPRAVWSIAVLLVSAVAISGNAQAPTAFERAWQAGTPLTIAGELTVIYGDDFVNHQFELIHSIRDDRTGQRFRLRFENGVPGNLRTGARVTARGRAIGRELYLADGASEVTVPNSNQLPTVTAVTGTRER